MKRNVMISGLLAVALTTIAVASQIARYGDAEMMKHHAHEKNVVDSLLPEHTEIATFALG